MRKNKMQMLSLLLAGTMVSTTVLPPASVLAAEENGIVAEEGIEGPENEPAQEEQGDAAAYGLELSEEEGISVQAETTRKQIVHYDFQEVNSTIVKDESQDGTRAGVIRNMDKGGTEIVDANIYGTDVRALSLPGGEEGGYLELPTGIFNNMESATINCWVNLPTDKAYQRIWDFGSDTNKYLYLLSDGANDGAKGYATAITVNGWGEEQAAQKEEGIEKNKWVLTTVVLDGANHTLTLYENGQMVAQREGLTAGLEDLAESTQNYIGRGQFSDPATRGLFADFSIYNYAMDENEVNGLFDVTDEGIVSADLAAIDLGDLSQITEDLTLPETGANGSQFVWSCDKEDVIDPATGKVTRPEAGQPDAAVKLTVQGSYGTAQNVERVFDITVPAVPDGDKIVAHDLEVLDLGDLSALTSSLKLPSEGEWGSAITWDTSAPEVITKEGVITRPEIGEEARGAVLTATAKKDGAESTRDFEVTVLPKVETASIESYSPITVKTRVGVSPSLPAYVTVQYSDKTSKELKTIWPAKIEKEDYSKEGTFKVSGKIVDEAMPIEATVNVVDEAQTPLEIQAETMDLSEITLDGDSILTQNRERTVEYLKLLDNDRMLYNFRATFGQDTKGAKPLGGWDEPKGLLRGHSTGHYMSALALAYASTKDEELKAKSEEMIHELRTLQLMSKGNAADFKTKGTPQNADQSIWSTNPGEWGEGFISAYSPDQFALLEQYTPYATIWAPYYTLHKIMAGFLDTYQYTGNEEALEAAMDLGSWVYERLNACTPEQREKMWGMYIAGEFGGFNESMAKLYNITGDEKYLEGAKFFDNKQFFDNLAANVDDIQGRHANQHIPQIVGAMEEYKATKDPYYYNIGKNFWDMVTSRYAYSIGGVGRGENFKTPYNQANDIESDRNCETCAAYNMLKLTKQLYQYSPDDASYMDYYERTLYNQIIASQYQETTSSMHNGTTYMLPIGPGVRKSYGGDYDSFTCCHGTGMENHVKYQEAAYYKSNGTLYVNLYMPSTVQWEEKGVSVTQENQFPSESTKLTVNGDGTFKMKLRVPYWATKGFTVKVNGEEVKETAALSSYLELDRNWKNGDVVEITMPFDYHLDKTPDKLEGSTVSSLMYGPLVMVAKNNKTQWLSLILSPDLSQSIKKVDTEDGLPTLKTNGMTFVPMYSAYNFAYHTYFKTVMSDEGGDVENWYTLTLNNRTPKFGSITADKVNIPEGGNVVLTMTPNEGYMVKQLLIDGKAVEVGENSTYTLENVTKDMTVEVSFRLINPPDNDPDKLEATANTEASYCSSWETLDAVNDGVVSETSLGNGVKHFGTWGNHDAAEEWVSYTWDKPVNIHTAEMYFFDNSVGGDGGVQVPSSYKYEYLNDNNEWTEVSNPDGMATEMDKFNVTTFDPVVTTSFRVTMMKKAAGVGIIEWKVKGDRIEPEIKEYTVTFVGKDGKTIFTDKVKEGDAATAPEVPEVPGWEFTGWDKDFSNVTGDMTVKALYKEIVKNGWNQDAQGRWQYVNSDGTFTKDTWQQIGGKWYYFDKDGYMQTGWLQEGNTWYYLKDSGAMATGWLQLGNTWYYLKASGAMVTGWLQLGNTWYYLRNSGAMATGWLQLGNTWYYLKANGAMATGWLLDGRTWYYLKSNGAMATGWLLDGKTWYYLKSNGAMATGWLLDGKTWYYLKSNGAMATGWLLDGKTWYYLKSNGAMATGWLLDGKTWYYLKSNGSMATGWVKVSGKWYYLKASGAMAAKQWVGKYYVNKSGVWTKTRR